MKRYSNYKDSGIEWLGEIPEHWEVKRLKLMAKIKNGQDYKLVHTDKPIYPVIGSGGQFAYASQYLFKGESVLLGRKGTVDKPLYVNCAFWTVDTMFYTKINNNTFPKFLYYSALTIPFNYLLTNTTVPSMTQYDLGNHVFAFPPLEEQKKIVYFIDHKLEQINHFISNKQRLIELLKEQKTAIINRAVTKGLNSHAPMKPSGIEWLGEIPEHWEVIPLTKNLSSLVDYRGKTPEKTESGIFLVTAKNIKNGSINYEISKEYISEKKYTEIMRRGLPKIGDILFTTEAPLGEVANVDFEKIALAQRIIKFRVQENILNPYFVKFLIMSLFFQDQIQQEATGSTAQGIKASKLHKLKIIKPSLQEQEEIVKYIELKNYEIDLAITKIEKEIELIKEYRTTLISDAVTGKIDVRI